MLTNSGSPEYNRHMISGNQNPNSLKEWFEATGVKQKFMANKWKVTEGHLSQIILLKTPPGSKLARTMSQDTGIPLENLLFPDEREVA